MFEDLFSRPTAIRRHSDSPLFEQRTVYLRHLGDEGASLKSLRVTAAYLLVAVEYLDLTHHTDKQIDVETINAAAARWAKRTSKSPRHRPGRVSAADFKRIATRWLSFLGRLQPAPSSEGRFAEQVAAYADYMQTEQGLSPHTIRGRCWFLRGFLERLAERRLEDTTLTQIDLRFSEVTAERHYSRTTARCFAGMLRGFFRYAETRGWAAKGMAAAIQGPRVYSQCKPPMGPSWEEVRRLLAMVEGDDPVDIRDRAILLLLAVYGLRAGEVKLLRLDDFDWEREQLSVTSSKSRKSRIMPLSRPVGDAVIRYLQEVRPRTSYREVFLRLQAPIKPLRSLWSIVGPRLRSLGVSTPHCGPHALRHACASHLLSQGMSLKEIGDHLGHSDPDATRSYAKVDLVGLRRVADFDLEGLL